MTPEEKAKELVEKFYSISGYRRFAIGYALICVDEIIKALNSYTTNNSEIHNSRRTKYWQEVKQEIEKL